jgi:hypothetical protein
MASSGSVSLPARRWQALAGQQGTGLDEDEGEAVSLDKPAQDVAGVVKRVEAGPGGVRGRQAGAGGRGLGQGAEGPVEHIGTVEGVAATADGRLLATVGSEGRGRLWDARADKELARLELDAPAWSVALDPDGRYLALGDSSGAVKVWEVSRLLRRKAER